MRRNILKTKEDQLNDLVHESENAVSLITATIIRIEVVNDKISEIRQEIESYQQELSRLDVSMSEQFDHNAKVINKFRSFLED